MNWRRWIRPGIVASVVLALLAFFLRSGSVQQDLAGRVTAVLAAEGQGWASVRAAGRSITIGGIAPSTESQQMAVELASSVSGVSGVSDRSDLLPIASPYVWSAKKTGRIVTLAGDVPSEAIRNSLLAAARRALPQVELHDEMQLARGASNGFNAAIAYGLARLSELADGMVTLTEGTISVTGVAASAAAYAEARASFQTDLPNAVVLGPVDLQPARAVPFVWSANYDGQSVTLAGYVPNEVVHETLLATTKAALSRIPVIDKMEIASGEPAGFAEVASYAITALARFKDGGITLDGLTLDVAGTARTVDDYEAVIAGFAENLPAGVTMVSNSITPATVSPYGWQGEKTGGAVVLTGYVPSLEDHQTLKTIAASLFGSNVTDHVRVAAGEPRMDWIGAIKFAIGELAKLGNGKVTLGENSYSIEGEAATPEAFAEILATNAHTLPASLEVDKADVAPPRATPYRFTVESGPAQITLDGYAPSEKDKEAILDAAHKKFGSLEVVDKLGFASGEPASFVAAATGAFGAVARLAGGRAEIIDNSLTIEGGAYYPSAAEEIASTAADSLPEGFAATTSITLLQTGQPVSPQHCRDLLQSELQKGRIEFSGSKAEITDDSLGLLDRVAAVFARCPDVKVEVGAHSDSEGSSSKNRDLTQARAEAIVDYLVDAGVKRERLTAVGYGEDKPVADNSTKVGKAANRRVEFTVELPEGG